MTTWRVEHGDCLDVMRAMPDASVDAVVTDPPYGLSFMGKAWDHGVPGVPFWTEALRVAKPGAHLLAFGGTRTFHRLAVAIEDAGWEVRDCLSWLYGSGFPKSHNLDGAMPTDDDGNARDRFKVRARNTHPTVKPVAVMQWLCRLVTPPNGIVLDPFTGSGTTGVAALREKFRFVGIEREAQYVEIARARIAAAETQPALPGVAA